ncbi:MAG: hypothetical protein EBS18_02230 [Actinobacteria bacterium]|nr:hypothetical protein [Actinomycetota bacterium]
MTLKQLLLVVLVLLVIWYLSFSASRLDRLHHRVETSWATLDTLLQKRAAIATEIVRESNLDPASSYLISSSARSARDAAIAKRSEAESVLSESLKMIQEIAYDESLELPSDLLIELSDVTSKIKLAINLHLEAVNSAKNVRRKAIIRLFRLAGKAPEPVKYAFEDDVL